MHIFLWLNLGRSEGILEVTKLFREKQKISLARFFSHNYRPILSQTLPIWSFAGNRYRYPQQVIVIEDDDNRAADDEFSTSESEDLGNETEYSDEV